MAKKTISKDIPLAELTLRRYEKPGRLGKRELVRKLCLSIGLLQPGDSRDVIVDVLFVLLNYKKQKKELSSEEVKDNVIKLRKKLKLPLAGIASSNIRRQLKRLRNIHIAEKRLNKYRITEFDDLSTIFEEKIEKLLLPQLTTRVKEYFNAVK
ncbi:MAG: hypothetical protein V1855_01305 [bacterium]